MASKKIKYSDIADGKVLEPLIKELKDLDKALANTAKSLIDLVKVSTELANGKPLDSFKNLQDVVKGIEETKEATKKLDKIEKERIKIQEKIGELDDERVKHNIRLREELKARIKQERDEAKLLVEASDKYKTLTKAVNASQAEFKKLAAAHGVNSKAAKDALKRFEELDEELREINKRARDGRRDVGRYEKAWNGLNSALGKLGILALITAALETMGDVFQSNTRATDDLAKAMSRLTIPIKVFTNRLIDLVKNLSNVGDIFTNFIDLMEAKADLAIYKTVNAFGALDGVIKDTEEKIKTLQAAIDGTGLTNAFSGMGEEIDDLTKKSDKLIDNTTNYSIATAQLQKDIAGLRKEQLLAQVAADNATTSLQSQKDARFELMAINEEIAARELQLAKMEESLAIQRASVNTKNVQLQNEALLATAARIEKEAEYAEQEAANLAAIRQINQDEFELNLDILIDIADRRKSINERIIGDDTKSLYARQLLLDQSLADTKKTYKQIEDEFNRFSGGALNIDELLAIEDTVEFNKRFQQITEELNIGDTAAGRLRETIMELLAAEQDLTEAQRDLGASSTEWREINSDIELQLKTLDELENMRADSEKVLTKLQEERVEQEIKNLRLRLSTAEEGSLEFAQIEQELYNKLIDQKTAAIEKEKLLEEKRKEEILEIRESVFTILRALNDKYNRERLENIEKEIQATEKREHRLQELAAQGNETAENNLALTRKRQDELERERERQLQRQKRSELALTAIETYTAKVQAGDKQPLASTIADIQVLRSFIDALPRFFGGTGDKTIGEILGSPDLAGQDGYLIRADKDERIFNPVESSMIKGMSNLEVAMLAKASKGLNNVSKGSDLIRLESKLEDIKTEIKNKPAYLGRDWNAEQRFITDTIKYNNKIERNHKKVGGIWGN